MSIVQPGHLLVERYKLKRLAATDLAEATAWEARDQVLGQEVRVTLVTGPHAGDALDAARRAALVTDPRLVRVLEAGSDTDGHRYIITEPHIGSTLTEIISGGLLDEQQARAIVGEAASALSVAHARGVRHTALRPSAVLIDGHKVRVTGLGLDGGLASGGALYDTPPQMDAQGLVAILYYAMTARWPGQSLEAGWIAKSTLIPLSAQRDTSGTLVPLSTLVPHVDTVIDSLVNRTFNTSGSTEGTIHPDDVTTVLRPWGEVSLVASLPGFMRPQPKEPQRQSVAQAFSGGIPPARRPATGRIAHTDGTSAMGNQPPPVPPPPPAENSPQSYAPGGYSGGGSPDQNGGFPTQPAPQRGGVNPTPIVLGLVGMAVAVGLFWAIDALRSPASDVIVEASATAPATSTEDNGSGAEPSASATMEARPVIDSITLLGNLEWEGQTLDHPEAVERAFDTDPATFYYTTTYQRAAFGGYKSYLGLKLNLREPAPVTKVELLTKTPGGKVQILQGGEGGKVLAEGTFAESVTLELSEPVVSGSFTIWVTELPQVSNGFRLELSEVVLS